MKRFTFLLTCAVAIAIAQTLIAGPEPLPSGKEMKEIAPAPPPECNWTGFYVGAFGGYSWGNLNFRQHEEGELIDESLDFHQGGFIGGGEAGGNWQIGSFVLGLEVTFAGGDFSHGASVETGGGEITDGHVDSNWLGTVGGRVGISFWHDHLLAFAKGGAGFTHFNFRTDEVVGGTERFRGEDDTRTGGLVGGGLEWAFNCHWSLKVEYNHIFFGDDEVTGIERSPGGVTDIRTFRADGDRDTVVGGLNFKF